jgi:hypothetical protein
VVRNNASAQANSESNLAELVIDELGELIISCLPNSAPTTLLRLPCTIVAPKCCRLSN